MRSSLVDCGLWILGMLLLAYFFYQKSLLNEAYDTISLQHEAILKQNEYLETQERYIRLLEYPPHEYNGHHDPRLL